MPGAVALGLIGGAICVVAFALLNFRVLKGSGYPYQLMNFVGAGCLAYSVAYPVKWGGFVLEVCWALFAVFGAVTTFRKSRAAAEPVTAEAERVEP